MKKVCFITHSPPNYLGGISLFHKHLLNYLKDKNLDITWAYFGKEDRTYKSEGLNYIELKRSFFQPKFVENNYKIKKFLRKNYFDVVFTTGGPWTYFYFKPMTQRIIHVFHGTVFHFTKNHMKRFGLTKKIFLYFLLPFCKFSEYTYWGSDKIICVSNKVRNHVKKLYSEDKIEVIRTGVDIKEFKPRKIKTKRLYGLYVGGGGWYTKGLDRAVKLSKEIYNLNKNYRLIVIGPDKNKIGDLLDEEFIEFKENVPRKEMKYYYNIADIFFCMSRYEGGAPTLATSEAMASGCMIVCSRDSRQEILKNNLNGLVTRSFGKACAKRILNADREKLIKNSLETIKEFSLEKWGDKFLEIIQK